MQKANKLREEAETKKLIGFLVIQFTFQEDDNYFIE